jgi:hypothetical protein
MFFESRNCQTSLSRKIGKVTVYKNMRGLYFNTKLSYHALNKNINSRFLGLNAYKITKLASIDPFSLFQQTSNCTAIHLAKMNYLALLLIALVAMAPSAVEAGKGKGKVRCVMSLRRVCGL